VIENCLRRGSLSLAVAIWIAESGSEVANVRSDRKDVVSSSSTPSRERVAVERDGVIRSRAQPGAA
jgi:hypothetical protein